MNNDIIVTAAASKETRLAGKTSAVNFLAGWENARSNNNPKAPVAVFRLDAQITKPILLVPGAEFSLFETRASGDKVPAFRMSVTVPTETAHEIIGKRTSGKRLDATDEELAAALAYVRSQKSA